MLQRDSSRCCRHCMCASTFEHPLFKLMRCLKPNELSKPLVHNFLILLPCRKLNRFYSTNHKFVYQPRPCLLCNLANSAALASNDCSHHVTLHQNAEWKISLAAWAWQSRKTSTSTSSRAATTSASTLHWKLHFQGTAVIYVTIQLIHSPVT